jgi:hypothetical protein
MQLIAGGSVDDLPGVPQSMTHLAKNEALSIKIKPYFDYHVIESLPGRMKWENGTLSYKNMFEALLYHMIDFKKQANLDIMEFASNPRKFYIHAASITPGSRKRPAKVPV